MLEKLTLTTKLNWKPETRNFEKRTNQKQQPWL